MMKSFIKVMLGMAVIPSLFTAVNANEINLLGDFSVVDASDSVSGNTLCDENADTSWKVENRFDYDIYSTIMPNIPKNSTTVNTDHCAVFVDYNYYSLYTTIKHYMSKVFQRSNVL